MEKDVPYIVYESEAARHERTVKRLIRAIVAAIVLLVISNLAWIWMWNQYDFSSESITVENTDEGNASYIGQSGVINNGE